MFKHLNIFTTNNEPITCRPIKISCFLASSYQRRSKNSYLAKEICCFYQWCFSLPPETLVNPAFMTLLWCLFRGFDRSYSLKGGHVVIEIPVNLLSFWFSPLCLLFGISNAKMSSEQGQNIPTVDRQEIVALQNKTLNKTISFGI